MFVLFRRGKICRNRIGFVGEALFVLKCATIAAEVAKVKPQRESIEKEQSFRISIKAVEQTLDKDYKEAGAAQKATEQLKKILGLNAEK